MSLFQVIKTELYKNSRRKSSLMMLIPMVLAFIITLGFWKDIIKLNITVGGNTTLSCMDYILVIWNVLSGLGIEGILIILFAAFQFSSEIEHGQIKLMLLRIGNRSSVVLGKFLSIVVISLVSILGTLLVSAMSYYIFIAHSKVGTKTFNTTVAKLSNGDIILSILLQILVYLILIAITFFIGLYANPFVTFILTMIAMYAINYLSSMNNVSVSKLFSGYWSNRLLTGEVTSFTPLLISVGCTFILACAILIFVMYMFQKRDIK